MKHKRGLKIRTRITLLYTVLSFLLMVFFVPVLYLNMRASFQKTFYTEMENINYQIFSSLKLLDEYNISVNPVDLKKIDMKNINYYRVSVPKADYYYNSTGSEWLSGEPLTEGFNALEHGNKNWAVYYKTYELGYLKVSVITAGTMENIDNMLRSLILWILILVPVYLLLAILGSHLLVDKALMPIRNITKTAMAIGSGDLSQRIKGITAEDEVGELTKAFNEMLDKVEQSFVRERQFSSDASHELRTPVAVISACAEDELEKPQNKNNENLLAVRQEAAKISKILSQLLMLTRGYEGRYSFAPEEINLKETIDSLAEELKRQCSEKNIVIYNQLEEDIEIKVDQTLITRLFINLMENAIKYGKKNGHIWINAVQGKDTIIQIRDDGIGISPEDLPHIFERFYRADKSRDRSGSGLGLSIAKWIVELHGGTITAKSTIGKGTEFTINVIS